MSEQELDLFQIAAVFAAELGAGPPQIVRSEALDPDLLGRLLDHDQTAQSLRLSPTTLPLFKTGSMPRRKLLPCQACQHVDREVAARPELVRIKTDHRNPNERQPGTLFALGSTPKLRHRKSRMRTRRSPHRLLRDGSLALSNS